MLDNYSSICLLLTECIFNFISVKQKFEHGKRGKISLFYFIKREGKIIPMANRFSRYSQTRWITILFS